MSLDMWRKSALLLSSTVVLAFLTGMAAVPVSKGMGMPNPSAGQSLRSANSKNITRVPDDNPVLAAVAVSQAVWPSTHEQNRPDAVILIPKHDWRIAVAGSHFIAMDGPALFYEKRYIPAATLKEIDRLRPKGMKDGVQVVVMGDADKRSLAVLRGYKVKRIAGVDPAEFAANVDMEFTKNCGDMPNSVIVASMEAGAKLYTLPAANWIAHMPDPLLYVTRDSIPEATKRALQARYDGANIYVLGPETVVGERVLHSLTAYGKALRIAAPDPAGNSVAFARYRDSETKFGWGVSEAGRGLSFVSTKTPDLATAGAPFAGSGKYTPLIWLTDGKATLSVRQLILGMKKTQSKVDPANGPYNHAYLLGSFSAVPFATQGMLDAMLESGKAGH